MLLAGARPLVSAPETISFIIIIIRCSANICYLKETGHNIPRYVFDFVWPFRSVPNNTSSQLSSGLKFTSVFLCVFLSDSPQLFAENSST